MTSRLLEADPQWEWKPQARDADKDLLAAAIATGSPEIVQQVLDNAPPRFDADKAGHAVGLVDLADGGRRDKARLRLLPVHPDRRRRRFSSATHSGMRR